MRRTLVAVCAFVAVMALPGTGWAQMAHSGNSGKTNLHVSTALVVGDRTLKPGDYTFQCVEIDGKHFLVVKSIDDGEITRVPCEPETLTAKVPISDFRTISHDGRQYLTAVRIKGEDVAHRLIPKAAE